MLLDLTFAEPIKDDAEQHLRDEACQDVKGVCNVEVTRSCLCFGCLELNNINGEENLVQGDGDHVESERQRVKH
jgi:hypothetical protein